MASGFPYSVSFDLAPLNAVALKDAQHVAAGLVKEPLELFTLLEQHADLDRAAEVAATLSRNTSAVWVLGIGGSSLGGQALSALAQDIRPHVFFFDNPDPYSFERALSMADLRSTRFLAISKSGNTAETLSQTLICADALEKAGGGKYLKEHFAVITENTPNPLRRFAESIGAPALDHPLGIGGRYSVLSVVGALPAILMGLDAKAIRAGARAVLETPDAVASGAALHWALAREGRLRETVLWPYADRLAVFGQWWRQLWAESLGKGGKGATPVAALGPVDQHSQLQLFLDGPGESVFTLMTVDAPEPGPVVPQDRANKLNLDYLAGRSLGQLVGAEARATAETLAARGRPVRGIHIPKFDERAIGALFMHFMLETIVMGRLMGVDPFDQPAVEEGKRLARVYLAGKSH